METIVAASWPELPYAAGKDTVSTLQLWTRVVVVLPRRRRRIEQTPVDLIFVAAAGLWYNLFNKLDDSAT
jgi:hypothetical protein